MHLKLSNSLTKTKNLIELDRYLLNVKKKARLEQNFFKLGINLDRDIDRIINKQETVPFRPKLSKDIFDI